MADLMTSLNKLKNTMDAKSASKELASTKVIETDPNNIINLPLWSEDKRALANDLVRSNLFKPEAKTKRPYYEDESVYCYGGKTTISYTGQELRTDDEDLLCHILHKAKDRPLGQKIDISAHETLVDLEWDTSVAGYKRLKATLQRLKATSVNVTYQIGEERVKGYSGSLIGDYEWEAYLKNKKRMLNIAVELSPRIQRLFRRSTYTLIPWKLRKEFTPTAKKLHAFYASHAKPFPLLVDTLYLISGSKTKSIYKFRQQLEGYLNELVQGGFLASWEYVIDEDDPKKGKKNKVAVRRR